MIRLNEKLTREASKKAWDATAHIGTRLERAQAISDSLERHVRAGEVTILDLCSTVAALTAFMCDPETATATAKPTLDQRLLSPTMRELYEILKNEVPPGKAVIDRRGVFQSAVDSTEFDAYGGSDSVLGRVEDEYEFEIEDDFTDSKNYHEEPYVLVDHPDVEFRNGDAERVRQRIEHGDKVYSEDRTTRVFHEEDTDSFFTLNDGKLMFVPTVDGRLAVDFPLVVQEKS